MARYSNPVHASFAVCMPLSLSHRKYGSTPIKVQVLQNREVHPQHVILEPTPKCVEYDGPVSRGRRIQRRRYISDQPGPSEDVGEPPVVLVVRNHACGPAADIAYGNPSQRLRYGTPICDGHLCVALDNGGRSTNPKDDDPVLRPRGSLAAVNIRVLLPADGVYQARFRSCPFRADPEPNKPERLGYDLR